MRNRSGKSALCAIMSVVLAVGLLPLPAYAGGGKLVPAQSAEAEGAPCAVLYKNGDLVIQGTTEPDGSEGHTAGDVVKAYEDVETLTGFVFEDGSEMDAPKWYEQGAQVTSVSVRGSVSLRGVGSDDSDYFTFQYCENLVSADLSGLDVTKAPMFFSCLFQGCESLERVSLAGLDTSSATGMGYMFNQCYALEHVDMSGVDTSKVSDMSGMFENCTALKTLAIGENTELLPDCGLPEGTWEFEDGDLSFDTTGEFIAATGTALAAGTWTLTRSDDGDDDSDDSDGDDDDSDEPVDNETVYVTAPDFGWLESAHPYADDQDKTWVYTDESAEHGMAVTFSDDTETEEGYDFIEIFAADAEAIGTYSGGELAGRTVYVPNSTSFSICLTSDGSGTCYGFKVTDVRALGEGEEIPDDDDNDAGDDEGDGEGDDEGDDEEEATVQSISFEPANPYVIVAETNGYWSDEGEDEDEGAADRFYCYYLPEFQEGDELTVVDLDGNSVVYTYCYDDDAEEWVFSSDDAGSIAPSCGSDQRENHWVLGDSNKMTLRYGGCSCEVPVSVIENPVVSISFEPIEAYKLEEGIDARWDGDDLFYETPAFAQGDN